MDKVYCVKETMTNFEDVSTDKCYFNNKGVALQMATLLKSKFLEQHKGENLRVDDCGECGFTIFDSEYDIDNWNYTVEIEEIKVKGENK